MVSIKYLCICDYGQVRSVGMKVFINGLNRENGRIPKLKYEAIAIGSVTSSKKTMKMLKKWADVIIDVRKWMPEDTYDGAFDNALQVECKKIWEDINKNTLKNNG